MDDNECMRREDGDGGALEDAVAAGYGLRVWELPREGRAEYDLGECRKLVSAIENPVEGKFESRRYH